MLLDGVKPKEIQNPLAPYHWRAMYVDGKHLDQLEDGYHNSYEIEKAKLAALIIYGHPVGDIMLFADPSKNVGQVKMYARRHIKMGAYEIRSTDFISFMLSYTDGTESGYRIFPDGKIESTIGDGIWKTFVEAGRSS